MPLPALLLTPADAADLLRISQTKVYALVHSGELAAVKVRGQIRIPRQAVVDYISSLEPVVRRPETSAQVLEAAIK